MTARTRDGRPGELFVRESAEKYGSQPVSCLGMAFESEDARRDYFLDRLKEKLPELRKRPDFPHGDDEDILRMSDPPYYTACPNPFLADFVEHHGRPYHPDEEYHREPYAVDVSVGKTDKLYRAHPYHTKVPHLAIVPSILHYTKPGDLVLDGFCGSGMTGVAAQWCGTAPESYQNELEAQWKKEGRKAPEWGIRRVILGDLSPAATFIAANYNIPFDVDEFVESARQLLDDVEEEVGWMYETVHTDGKAKGRINYTVWSEVFSCRHCAAEIVFLNEAFTPETGRISKTIKCPECGAKATKENLDLVFETSFDHVLQRTDRRPKRVPLFLYYVVGKSRLSKRPQDDDIELLRRVTALGVPTQAPTVELPDCQMTRVGRVSTTETRSVRQMFIPRAVHALTAMWRRATATADHRLRNALLFFVEQAVWTMSLLNRFRPTGYSQVSQYLSGVYYIPSQHSEPSPWYVLAGKRVRLGKAFDAEPSQSGVSAISTGDCSRIDLPTNCVDYVFTDPPFGENIYYADLNYLVESWHRVVTRADPEAIMDRVRNKDIAYYQRLMQNCFIEYFRVLKPGRWITVVFHNSKNTVWNAIQEAMLVAGFVVADVRTLDKKQGSFKQVTSTAVKQDLVISAYKPTQIVDDFFQMAAGSEAAAWKFVSAHLRQVPVFVSQDGLAETIVERQRNLLYDRMVAFHVQRGATVPLSASEFHAGLLERFAERDDMYFLPGQVAEYDRKRLMASDIHQVELFVHDEETAIRWLRRALRRKPRSFQDIHPDFVRELAGWGKNEKMLELTELLRENFLFYDGNGDVPSQIHSYLSSNFKYLRNLPKDDSVLRRKAAERWYVPDPRKAGDLAKLRERALLREFAQYCESTKPLKRFRSEAIRGGFRKAWQERDYDTIVAVGTRVPDSVLHNDPKLLMWYDQAVTRAGGDG